MILNPVLNNAIRHLRKSLWACAVLFCVPAMSQVIGNWNFNSNTSGTAGSYNTVSVADFSSAVPTRTFNGGGEYYGEDGWPTGAINPTMYIEFSLTPNAGYSLNISNVNIRVRHSSVGPSGGSGPTRFSLRSSLDGYAADLGSGSVSGAYLTYNINPGGAFTNLPSGVTFRIYGYQAILYSGGYNRFVFDNIYVEGIGVILPVKIREFTTRAAGEKVFISYSILDATAGTEYSLERSNAGTSFSLIHTTKPIGNATAFSASYTDQSLPVGGSQLYYRLKIKSPDGGIHYSAVNSVRMANLESALQAFVRSSVLTITGQLESDAEIAVFTNGGVLVAAKKLSNIHGYQSVSIPLPTTVSGALHVITQGKTTRQSTSVIAM